MIDVRLLISLSRLHLALVGASSSLVFGYCLTGQFHLDLMGVVVLDWLLVNLCNKASDWKEDQANKVPYHHYVQSHRQQILAVSMGLILASLVYHLITQWELALVRVIGHLLALAYNFPILPGGRRLKSMYMIKNLASCLGFLITLFGYTFASKEISPEVDLPFVLALFGFFVPVEIAFEIIYDLRDIEGDRQENIRTFPVVHGKEWAQSLVITLDIISILLVLLSLELRLIQWKEGVLLFGAVLHLLSFLVLASTNYDPQYTILVTWAFVAAQVQYAGWVLTDMPVEAQFLFGAITPTKIIDIGMLVVALLTFVWNLDRFTWWQFWVAYLMIAVSGGLCENTCIWWYDFYHYNQEVWYAYVGAMPVEVTIIWPQVIFGSHRLMRDNFGLRGFTLAAVGASEVFGLAYFVEIVCVSRGFWTWTKSNIMGVPVIGVIGWAVFAFCAFLTLEVMRKDRPLTVLPVLCLPLLSMGAVHASVLALWHAGFAYLSEIDLSQSAVCAGSIVAAVGMLGAVAVFPVRSWVNLRVSQEIPRLVAAGLLFYTLLKGQPSWQQIVISVAFALPYLGCLRWDWPFFTTLHVSSPPPPSVSSKRD